MPEERGYMPEEHGYMEAMNLVANTFATQPVWNAARAAHVLRADQNIRLQAIWIQLENYCVFYMDFDFVDGE